MVPLPFDRTEYAQRLARIRRDMASRKIDLLVVTDVANQHYITGYDGWSFYTPQVVLVPLENEEPVWVGRAMDAAGGLRHHRARNSRMRRRGTDLRGANRRA